MSFIAFNSTPSGKPLFSQPKPRAEKKKILLEEMPASLPATRTSSLIQECKEKYDAYFKSVGFDVVVKNKERLVPQCCLRCFVVVHKFGSTPGDPSNITFETEEDIDRFKKRIFSTIWDFAKPYMYNAGSGDDLFELYSPKQVAARNESKNFIINKRWFTDVNEATGKVEVVFKKVTRKEEREEILASSVSLVARRRPKKRGYLPGVGVPCESDVDVIGPAEKKKKGVSKLPIPFM